MPLYYFAKDAKAGDTNGQGLNGKWFVASPTGAGTGGTVLVGRRQVQLLIAAGLADAGRQGFGVSQTG